MAESKSSDPNLSPQGGTLISNVLEQSESIGAKAFARQLWNCSQIMTRTKAYRFSGTCAQLSATVFTECAYRTPLLSYSNLILSASASPAPDPSDSYFQIAAFHKWSVVRSRALAGWGIEEFVIWAVGHGP